MTSKAGFVYIFLNPSFPEMLKIGLTQGKSGDRATILSRHTGVPTEFIVIYDELVDDCRGVEKRLHERFARHRVRKQREFFYVSPKEAISALQEEAASSKITKSDAMRIDILPKFEARCRRWLRSDLIGLTLVQFPELVFLEEIYQPNLGIKDLKTERIALDFIAGGIDNNGDGLTLFDPNLPPEINARELTNFDPYGIINCFSFFSPEACKSISQMHNYGEPVPFAPPQP